MVNCLGVDRVIDILKADLFLQGRAGYWIESGQCETVGWFDGCFGPAVQEVR